MYFNFVQEKEKNVKQLRTEGEKTNYSCFVYVQASQYTIYGYGQTDGQMDEWMKVCYVLTNIQGIHCEELENCYKINQIFVIASLRQQIFNKM